MMKKVLAAGAALTLVAAVASTAAAEVNISGDARARYIFKNSYDFGNTDQDSYDTFDSRVRFQLKGTTAGGAYVVGRLRLIDTKWNGAEDASADQNIWADKAYIGIPLGNAFTIEAGYYQETLTDFLYEDIDVAGVRGLYKSDPVDVTVFYHHEREGQLSENGTDVMDDNDAGMVGGAVIGKINDAAKVQLNVIYVYNDQAEETTDFLGDGFLGSVYGSYAMGAFLIDGEFAYAEADVYGREDDGMGGYVRGTYTMDALELALQTGFTKDSFMPDVVWGFQLIGSDDATTVVNIGDGGDWLWVGGYAKYNVSEALYVKGNAAWADIDGEYAADVLNRWAKVWEVSGEMNYTIVDGADFNVKAGYLQPDFDGDLTGIEDDGAFGAYGRLQVEF
jgi:hypothetical protein